MPRVQRVVRMLLCVALVCAGSSFSREALATELPVGVYPAQGTYIGMLSCKDCSGIWTTLTLNDPGPNVGIGSGDFVIVERFSGGVHGGETVTTRGAWFIVGRHPSDGFQQNGTLELQPQSARGTRVAPRFFMNTSGLELQQLDSAMNPFLGGGVLRRVIPPPTPNFGPLQIEDAGKTVYMKVGDTIDVTLSTGSSPDNAWMLSGLADPIALKYAVGGLSGTEYSQQWTFSMVAPGKTVLTFSDIRPETAGPRHASLTFTFYVSS